MTSKLWLKTGIVISYQLIIFSILTIRKPTRETTEDSVVAERPYESLGSVTPQTSTSFYMGLVSRDTTSGNDVTSTQEPIGINPEGKSRQVTTKVTLCLFFV